MLWCAAVDGSLFRALALLATGGASFALFVQELRGGWLPDFVRSNALSLHNRNLLAATMGAGAGLTAATVRRAGIAKPEINARRSTAVAEGM